MSEFCPIGQATRIHGSGHRGIDVRHLWLLHLMTSLQMFASMLCDFEPNPLQLQVAKVTSVTCNWSLTVVLTQSASLVEGYEHLFFCFVLFLINSPMNLNFRVWRLLITVLCSNYKVVYFRWTALKDTSSRLWGAGCPTPAPQERTPLFNDRNLITECGDWGLGTG